MSDKIFVDEAPLSNNRYPLSLHEKEMRKGVRLDLNGRMIGGVGSIAFRNRIRDLLKQGKNKIALDLYDVISIDSFGMDEFVSALVAAVQTNGKIIFLHLRDGKVKRNLIEANLLIAFEIARTEEEAIQLLSK
jgi:anti-anti-sigma regulatory factor